MRPASRNEAMRNTARIQVVPHDFITVVDGLCRHEGGTEARRKIERPEIMVRLQKVVLGARGVGECTENLLPIVD